MTLSRLAVLVAALSTVAGPVFADRLDDIRKAGVVRVAVFDSNPPFGFLDGASRHLNGLDVEYAQAIAKKIGVKLELVPTNPANRIPLLVSGKADLVAANFTVTDERRKQVDFSVPYFASGQQFIVRKGTLKSAAGLAGIRVGVDKGTTQEVTLREKYPKTALVAYDDTPLAFAALRNGNVQAISQDGSKLAALLANAPDKQKYEIAPFTLTREYQAIGLPRGESKLLALVNQTLHDLEKNGSAAKIYDRWFGPSAKAPLPRDYRIGDKL
ncbi:ABC transporter substrate-binding protein [Paludibacterium paludis]|uniref:Amino acid ABC transporter substrate-binding protein n=1 Tax=Paludibacterium paludis TaxID=1225769 RepID=A0A918NYF3_9NEIS|nr:ABC transporter substrate-binding protein [Paludibacterium paludis]GGY06434.1 amino acid ABC transporter substrate-binding protein [Paludibacterium paludis]